MQKWRFFLVTIALLATFFSVTSATVHKTNSVWKSIARAYTPELHRSMAASDFMDYVLKQTHEPLFHYETHRVLSSRVLKSWDHDDQFLVFNFCISESAQFEPGAPLEAKDVVDVFNLYPVHSEKLVSADGKCIRVTFAQAQPTLYMRLTDYTLAPSRNTADPRIEIGLGPFKMISADKKQMVLVRKVNNPKKRFDRIEIKSVDQMTDQEIDDHSIQDFNHAPPDKYPWWVDKEYQEYAVPALTVYALVLNMTDETIRQAIYNCFDIQRFQDYFDSTLIRNDIQSLYPLGVRGAVPGRPLQNCQNANVGGLRSKPLVFLDWQPKISLESKNVLESLSKVIGVDIQLKSIRSKDLIDMLLKRHNDWDIAPVIFDSDHGEAYDYLEGFLEPKETILKYHLKDLEADLQRLKTTVDETEKTKIAVHINDELLKRAVVLPLFQKTTARYYYPKDLKNLSIGKTFAQYPDIDAIE